EAEYMAVDAAIKEVLWPTRLLEDLGETQQAPTQLLNNNTASPQSWSPWDN
ncbi:hypothetical protein SELMODRAFT_129840, partial [Selaginella moellendorffii]